MLQLPRSPALFCLDMRNESRPSVFSDLNKCSWCCPVCKRPLKHKEGLGFFAHYTGSPLCEESNQTGFRQFVSQSIQALTSDACRAAHIDGERIEVVAGENTHALNIEDCFNEEGSAFCDETSALTFLESLKTWLLSQGLIDESSDTLAIKTFGKDEPDNEYAHEKVECLTGDAFNFDEIEITELVEDEPEHNLLERKEAISDSVAQLKTSLEPSLSAQKPVDLKVRMKQILTSQWIKDAQLTSKEVQSLRAIDVRIDGVAEDLNGWWSLIWLDAISEQLTSHEFVSSQSEQFLKLIVMHCELKSDSLKQVKSVLGSFSQELVQLGILVKDAKSECLRLSTRVEREKKPEGFSS